MSQFIWLYNTALFTIQTFVYYIFRKSLELFMYFIQIIYQFLLLVFMNNWFTTVLFCLC